ncbi:unnamed protein product [Rotaria sp. Silwood2]|nr:unnamed protein product [Rotaria sp. Silwood2]CAF2838824.1 unnamed protein product [Rotaria sp. Silwood2]CAF3246047.1 unnamed protein product [Rotaria sp. Silwood2]CAF4123678.1 unnamed protein product [Rotaria sp. Silwood2]CAF4222924.1 unnamed protein product [Rotaria sp. Silwood2]
MECNTYDKYSRKERFTSNPIAPKRPCGSLYGFISPFIKAIVKDFRLTKDQLPSKNEAIIPMIVEKAALGIIEEGKEIGKQDDAEKIAKTLLSKKELGMEEVWKCCAKLYSLPSFLYQKLNEAMRLIGSEEHEQVWRSKVQTLGPFSLLLWDNPFNSKMTKPDTILYRGAELSDDFIASLQEDYFAHPKPLRSFQAFTSCTRNLEVAKMFGNVLFVMELCIAFTVDLQKFSNFPDEEEELLLPGVCFTIDQMEFDTDEKKYVIYLTLQQRHARTDQHEVFRDVAQIKQQHSNHSFFHSNPNYRANFGDQYELILHNNPAFHLLRRDDHDTSIDMVIGALASRATDRYNRFGRDSDWNDA